MLSNTYRPLFAAFALIAATTAGAHAQDRDGLDALTGTWKARAADGGRATIARAVEKGVEPMGFIKEPIARRRLLENNPPLEKIVIRDKGGGSVEVVFGGSHVYRAKVGGPAAPNRAPDGDTVKVTHRLRGSTLVQKVSAGGSGGSTMVFRPDADGDRLAVTMTIESKHLPSPIRYTLHFTRAR